MTDSPTRREQGKRDRLVAGARELLHQQGVEATTIAEIARAADVPVGNVYYYFKTKDELVEAAIAGHTNDVHAVLNSLERHRTPQARLKALVRALPTRASWPPATAARSGASAPSSTNAPTASTKPPRRCFGSRSTGPSSNSGSWAGATPATSRSR